MAGKPMTGQAFFVLTALADAPRHGYGIAGEVAELSQGRVKLKIGSLYGVLDRLAPLGPDPAATMPQPRHLDPALVST